MNRYEFWLASNSPRRRELLGWADWRVNLVSSDVDESMLEFELAENYVKRLAVIKLTELKDIPDFDFVLAADTIVVLDDEILGKPTSEEHAISILCDLRGRTHVVMTALAVRQGGQTDPIVELCKSEVKMRNYSDTEIYHYVDSGDSMDKAGAYAIQNPDLHPVVDFKGCVASVMGMPLCHLERSLRKYRFYEETEWPRICQMKLKYTCPITDQVMAGDDLG